MSEDIKGQTSVSVHRNDNIPTRFYNMDLVRYFLSIAVIVAHFNILFDANIPYPISSGTAVGAFFGISGYLVYASYLKSKNFNQYLSKRIRRIIPAYYFIVIASAFLLSALSSFDLFDYFTNSETWKYLVSNLCFLNFLQPELPGVFSDNPITAVNGSLWTLKVEWMLYLSIPIFFLLITKIGAKPNAMKLASKEETTNKKQNSQVAKDEKPQSRLKSRVPILVLAIFAFSLCYNEFFEHLYVKTGKELYHILSYQFVGQMIYFYTGVLLYHYRKTVTNHRILFLLISCLLLAIDLVIYNYAPDNSYADILHKLLMPVCSVTVLLTLSIAMPQITSAKCLGNCSYEMYLCHFPILQAFACLPAFCSLPIWASFVVCITTVIGISYLINKYISNFRKLNL